MNSKERVKAALNGERADRISRFIWANDATKEKLAQYLGISMEEVETYIGNDVKQTWLSINREMERPWPQGGSFTDEWGIVWRRDGYYNMVTRHPLAELSEEEIRAYPVPDARDKERYEGLDGLIGKYGAEYFIGADISGTIFEPAYHLRGLDNLLMDMASESGEADLILDMTMQQSIAIAREALKRPVDWVWLGDDVGTQKSMMMSPDLWRKYLKPRMKKVIDEIRRISPEIPVAYHSCGSIRPILKDLEEVGINVINPLQESSCDMDHAEIRNGLKAETVMFCGIDTQTFLLTEPADAVGRKMTEILELLAARGRYICGVSHTLQPDIPSENIEAMIQFLNMYKV